MRTILSDSEIHSSPVTPVAAASVSQPRPTSPFRRALADSGLEQLSVRWRFRLVVIAFGLPFLAYIVWSAAHDAAIEKQRVLDRAQANSALVASRFHDQIEQIDRLLATLSQSLESRIGDGPGITALLVNLRSYVPPSVNNIGVWNLKGENLGALDRRTLTQGFTVADREYFKKAIERRDLAFEGPILSRTTSSRIIQFARPIFNERNEVIAVISMSLRSDDLVNQFDPGSLIRKDALITIVNEQGFILSRSVESDLWVGKVVADPAALKKSFAYPAGTDEEMWLDGQRRLVGSTVVPSWPWMVKVAVPLESVLGPVSNALMRDLGLGLLILVLALIVAGRVASWTARPLVQLAIDAERLGRGDLAHRSQVVAGAEVGTLAHNFNLMATALEQRDRDLAASQMRLHAITENIPEHIVYLDAEERFRFVNAFAGAFVHHAPAEMIGRTLLEFRGTEVHAIVSPMIQNALAGHGYSGEVGIPVDGRLRKFQASYVPDRAPDGSIGGVYIFAHDITERKDAELLHAESEKRLALIADNVPAMICYLDMERRFRFANRAFETWFRKPLDAIIGQTMASMMVPDIAARYEEQFARCITGHATEFELEIRSRSLGTRWLKCNFIPDFDTSGQVRGVYGMIHNVTEAKAAEARLTRLARYDTLTGLANRHQFNESLERVLTAQQETERPLALMFLDIDHFKEVNDQYGHACGDDLLKAFAQRLVECVRPTDLVARLSGDEFVVLLDGLHSEDESQFIARKIIAAVEKPFSIDPHRLWVTTSIGVAVRADLQEAASLLMKRADEALYEAKREGRNTFRLAS